MSDTFHKDLEVYLELAETIRDYDKRGAGDPISDTYLHSLLSAKRLLELRLGPATKPHTNYDHATGRWYVSEETETTAASMGKSLDEVDAGSIASYLLHAIKQIQKTTSDTDDHPFLSELHRARALAVEMEKRARHAENNWRNLAISARKAKQ